ncbi:MAG: CehA/McbA family metallohydrolase [Deltaproteobacteria bacterium]|nr:CehA/McbA family metallohydrolase [Deltaproteobacteria bacterium]
MSVPASDRFLPLPLNNACNADRAALPDALAPPPALERAFGAQGFRGIPFLLGPAGAANVVLVDEEPVSVAAGLTARYLVFVHYVADRASTYLSGFADSDADGNELGDHVANYVLRYADGTEHVHAIRRRFAIQQARIGWGASPFAAIPLLADQVIASSAEDQAAGRSPAAAYGRGETRHGSGRDAGPGGWLYALPNPHPDRAIDAVELRPAGEPCAVYGIAATELTDHPLRPGTRRKLVVDLAPGMSFNGAGELEGVDIDLGTVISARRALDYDESAWRSGTPNVQPAASAARALVEYAAHPAAKLYLGDRAVSLQELAGEVSEGAGASYASAVAAAERPVKITVTERGSPQPVAVRLHLHGAAGEYLPPKGNHRTVNGNWFEDNYGEFVNGLNQYAYIPGECVADLPLGEVFVEICRGYEVRPLRTRVTVTPQTRELTFELERVLRWRERGWVTADTHVHFLSPQTALLEGAAEGVNVVNLLASQWGEMFSNVSDFDGATTLGARDFGGSGEFLVRVGTENRMQVLGHISLLGYAGAMIHPLCTGGPSESAIGDPQEVTMADWATRCLQQGGLVVMPHAPNPQCERAADIVLGVVDAMEMMTFNPCEGQLNPYGIADWYRYLNLGYLLPVVGGSDKMAAASQLGGVRTYTQLGELEFTYDNWMAALRAGNTFVTVGPLAELTVEGRPPGATVELPPGGGTVSVQWRVESVAVPIASVELVHGGVVAEQVDAGGALALSGSASVRMADSSWLALRVRGSYRGGHDDDIAAHTSAVQVRVGGARPFSAHDAGLILDQIEGALAYVDTIAPRPDARRYRQLRATLEGAWNRLHQTMHRHGVFHQHTPLHDHASHHEH